MEIDLSGSLLETKGCPGFREIAESFEDPNGLRFYPDSPRFLGESRAFCLGKTLSGLGIFSVYRSDGKKIQVIVARPMTEEEIYFYERKLNEWNS